MNTEIQRIEIRGLQVDIVRKDIKNLHVGVYPPNGRVRVATPARLSNDAVRLAVISRLGWIRRQQAKFQQQERQSQREMVSGETHFVQGRRYRLDVVTKDEPAKVVRRTMRRLQMYVRPRHGREARERVLDAWYREFLHEQITALVAKWEPRIGVRVNEWGIRRMKTHWGTCNRQARRIYLNLELAKKPRSCLEFIIVHEMVHLIERHHNDLFKEHMDKLLPHWRQYRQELNCAPLSHQSWRY